MYARVVSEAVTGHQGFEMCVPIFRRVGLKRMRGGGEGSPCQVIFRNEKELKRKILAWTMRRPSMVTKGLYTHRFFSCVGVAANSQVKSGVRE